MGEQGVFLEYGVQISLVGRKIGNILSVKNNLAEIRRLETAQDTESSCLTTAAGA